jgi:hypothetical protein
MKERLRRVPVAARLAVLAIAGIATLGITAMAAVPAQASMSCYGFSCHGLDPLAAGCAATKSTTVLAQVNDPLNPETVAVVNNNYSSDCSSNWASATLTQQGYNDGDTMAVIIEATDSQGNLESMCYPGPSGTGALNEYCYQSAYRGTATAFTDMVDGTNVTQAFVYVYDFNGDLIARAESDQ